MHLDRYRYELLGTRFEPGSHPLHRGGRQQTRDDRAVLGLIRRISFQQLSVQVLHRVVTHDLELAGVKRMQGDRIGIGATPVFGQYGFVKRPSP